MLISSGITGLFVKIMFCSFIASSRIVLFISGLSVAQWTISAV